MGRLLTTFKDKTFEPSMKSYFQLYTDATTTASQIYDSLLYVRGTNAGSLVKDQENDDATVSTVEAYDTYMPVRFYNVKSTSDGETPTSANHTFFSVYNRAEYNGPDGENMYDLWADRNLAKLSGASYITNTIGGAYNYGLDAGSGDSQTIPGVYGAVNLAKVEPTGDTRTVSYLIGSRDWAALNKSDATATYVYPMISEFTQTIGTVGTLAMLKLDLDYTAGAITNGYYIWAEEGSVPTPSGEKYFIKSNIPWPTLLSSSLTNTGAVTFQSTLAVTGTTTLSSNLLVYGNTTLGNAATDTVTVTADVASNLIPSADSTYTLGDASNYWSAGYIDAVTTTGDMTIGGNLVVTGTSTFNGGTITIGDANTDNVVFGADVDSHIIPDDDDTYDLGSNAQQWRNLYINGTAYLDAVDIDGNIQIDGTLTVGVDDTGYDVKFFGDTASKYLLWDASEDTLYATGEIDAGSLDISGDIDVDGTSNLDAVDIDGAVQIDNTLTIGVDDVGYDVKFFGDTASRYMLWDTSADSLKLTDTTYLMLGTGDDLRLYHNGTDSHIDNYVGNLNVVNNTNNGLINFYCDDASNGVIPYLTLNGSGAAPKAQFFVDVYFASGADSHPDAFFIDQGILQWGTHGDLQIQHDGTDSSIVNIGNGVNGDLIIEQQEDNKDIILKNDNGSGSTTAYITLDGDAVSTTIATIKVLMPNLPTSDPGVAGQLWNSSATLKISAG